MAELVNVLSYPLLRAAGLYAYRVYPRLPRPSPLGEVITSGPTGERCVALTFDDGPNPPATERVLDILAAEEVHATFFLVGVNARAFPATVQRLLAAGHALGNHSYRHERADAVLDLRYREAERAQRAIETATGVRPRYYRSPFGLHTPWQLRAVNRAGMRAVHWNVDSHDWRPISAQEIVDRVLRGLRSGAIVLLHDGVGMEHSAERASTLAALPRLIDGIRARGYRLVTVPEMLAGCSSI